MEQAWNGDLTEEGTCLIVEDPYEDDSSFFRKILSCQKKPEPKTRKLSLRKRAQGIKLTTS